ncbi:glucose-6-phosphate isomerase [Candidatus Pelagibacter sp.]|nr:glucose-6-phosphate isomerase [Candidatus Pelagibacter sp.]
MFSNTIIFKNFKIKNNNKKIKKDFEKLLKEDNEIIKSLSTDYKNNYNRKLITRLKKYINIRIIGMGGSILGTKAIYYFLKHKIKKNLSFIDNLNARLNYLNKKNNVNLLISKSGNTLETISNANFFINKKDKNIFITEDKKSYLLLLAEKLKAEIIHHNENIGGRFSVLSEVGMLPAELMGLDSKKFKQINNLIRSKKFVSSLIVNVANIIHFSKIKKFNSIILNYDESSNSFFKWYQQLVAESLGKKGNGILPIISTMPRDNHSLMQLYLDGPKNNFFTFFYVKEKNSTKINNKNILSSYNTLKEKSFDQILYTQKLATENVFKKKKIPFRSFEIKNRNEETLGELFCFFILETILVGRALKVNPYDQPSVELIKKETKKILI